MRRRVLISIAIALAALMVLAFLPVYRAGDELLAARDSLTVTSTGVDAAQLRSARERLERAATHLSRLRVRFLDVVPVIGANIDAIRATLDAARPALDAAVEVGAEADAVLEKGSFFNGRLHPETFDRLHAALTRQRRALTRLEQVAVGSLGGWLVPPVWEALDRIRIAASDLAGVTRDAAGVTGHIDGLFGAHGRRRYLVMSVNNAELRGAGGLLSAIGTISVEDGRIRVERMYARESAVRRPYRAVPAPADYVARYGDFKANTTLWANVTYSPDFPDDAVVGARLYKSVMGTGTDGVLMIDPKGLAALMPDGAAVPVAGTDRVLAREDLAAWMYSGSYAAFRNHRRRRAVALAVGQAALERSLSVGLPGRAHAARIARAFAGGHLRLVPFDQQERAAMNAVNATGDIGKAGDDVVLIAAHNLGDGAQAGTKLDYWTQRDVAHACDISDGAAVCSIAVTFKNRAPKGLTRYVAGRPYGMLRTYVETFVPAHARVTDVSLDGRPVPVRIYREEQLQSLAVYAEVPRGQDITIRTDYELSSIGDSYSLEAVPQPLARDAAIRISLRLPEGWTVSGRQAGDGNIFSYSGSFDRTLTFEAAAPRQTGLSAAWDRLVRFWRQPLF